MKVLSRNIFDKSMFHENSSRYMFSNNTNKRKVVSYEKQ